MLPFPRTLLFLMTVDAVLGFTDDATSLRKPTAKKKSTTTEPPFLPMDDGTFIDDPNKFFVDRVRNAVDTAPPIPAAEASAYYPTVNIRPWLQPEWFSQAERDEVVQQVLEYASTNGAFDIVGHDIPEDVFSHLEQQGRTFFDLPLDEKRKYTNPSTGTKGGYTALGATSARALYGGEGEARDLRETYSVVHPFDHEYNVAPPTMEFEQAVEDYMTRLELIDTMLHRILTEALSFAKGINLPENYLNEAKGGVKAYFRLSHSPPLELKDDRFMPHSDWGSMTLIFSTSPGLEEVGPDGRWVKAPTGRLHVTLGEVMHMWSNGLFKANIHRVAPGNEDRISFLYFCAVGVTVEADNLLDGEGVFPIVAPSEKPLFDKISVEEHSVGYYKKFITKAN